MNTEFNPFQAPLSPVMDQNEVSSPAKIFSASGRLNRIRYLAYSTGLSMLVMLAVVAITAVLNSISPIVGSLGGLIAGVAYIYIFILQITLAMQRCHDFDTSGWFAPLVLIPFAVLVFWIIPGSATENRFGKPNPPNTALAYLGALVLPFIVVLGIVAAIAIPAYSQYSKRVKAPDSRYPVQPTTPPITLGPR